MRPHVTHARLLDISPTLFPGYSGMAERYVIQFGSNLADRGQLPGIGDYCAPEIMCFCFTPLYTRYMDVRDTVDVLADISTTVPATSQLPARQ